MKKFIILALLIGYAVATLAQTPQGFNYQAVIRDAEGQPLAEQVVSIRLTLQCEAGDEVYYTETHTLPTSPHGVVSVAVGSGDIEKGSLVDTPWAAGSIHLKVEVDPTQGGTYSLLGTTPLLAVPYALFAASGNEGPQGPEGPSGPEGPLVEGEDGQTLWHDGTKWAASSNIHNADANVGIGTVTPTEKLEVAGNIKAHGRFIGQGVEVIQPQPEEEPIFVVRNSKDEIVFAVYESGVRVYVDDSSKSSRGGFAVGGLSDQNKEVEGVHYLRVTPDSVRVNIKTPAAGEKSSRGGFAVGGLSDQNKGTPNDLLFIAPEKARIYVKTGEGAKSSRGGFAVGGLSDQNKDEAQNFLFLTPENYFIGHRAGTSTTTGQYNSFIGYEAGLSNTEGNSGIFLGYKAGLMNTIGDYNVFLGNHAGYSNIDGYSNIFIGDSAGVSNTSGNINIFIGKGSGVKNTTGNQNTFVGHATGYHHTTAFRNVFLGTYAGHKTTTGGFNVFIGNVAGRDNKTGGANIYIGQGSGATAEASRENVYIGQLSGAFNTKGSQNVFIGSLTGAYTDGSYNTFVGERAGSQSKGSGNVFIGNRAGQFEQNSNRLYIDNTETTIPLIYGEFDNRNVEINGSLKIKDMISLKPRFSAPGNPEIGDIFFDAGSNSVKFYNGIEWMEFAATSSGTTPIVETLDIPEDDLLAESCKVIYNIASEGSSAITSSGVYYRTTPFHDIFGIPFLEHSTTNTGELTIDIENLTPATRYYVRSFATNDEGTALGNILSFTTRRRPTAFTHSVTNIQQTSATAGGQVSNQGDAEVTERGVCWSTSPTPTINDNKVICGNETADFFCEITDLQPETTYYVRAFATNKYGTGYGQQVVFATAPTETTVEDSDGNTYSIVQIGIQTWLGENLKTTKYRNGDEIPNETVNVQWEELTSGAFCWYNNDEATNKDTYGALYNFYAVEDSRNLCPEGWRVASSYDWSTLIGYFFNNVSNLKEEGTEHWSHPNYAANSSGFTALPGGFRSSEFESINNQGWWWTSSASNGQATYYLLQYNLTHAQTNSKEKFFGFSVRCIKE